MTSWSIRTSAAVLLPSLARMDFRLSHFVHDLFRKPVPTPDQVRGMLIRDHALSLDRRELRRNHQAGALVDDIAGFDVFAHIDLPIRLLGHLRAPRLAVAGVLER